MKRSFPCWVSAVLVIGPFVLASDAVRAEPRLEALLQEFEEYSGADIVFHRDELPEGRYHDVLKPLNRSGRLIAAAICVKEARMYPPGYLRELGPIQRPPFRLPI